MQALQDRKILLGVTGGIAAYKAAELVRLLIKAGAQVRVVMTPAAREFVQPLTYQALSGHRVYLDLFDAEADSAMDHIELARWCDLLLVAPASADFLGKMCAGYADNLLLTLCLASRQPVAVAPAMNQQMFASPGRMLEPAQLLANLEARFQPGKLHGVNILLTAGPTREAIDPVRYISNRSSGKMGYALASAALQAGASVTLVSGPVALAAPAGAKLIAVESARQMLDAVMREVDRCDVFIACAAVSDYRVAQEAEHKIKKTSQAMTLTLVPNADILATVSALERRPFCVGFAAETRDLEKYARDKLERKNLDMIAANLVAGGSGGFEADVNRLEVLWRGGRHSIAEAGKFEVAKQLIDLIGERYTGALDNRPETA